MIHQVVIKSLPQEWLWCETWCDDASKVTAKTIDLVSPTAITSGYGLLISTVMRGKLTGIPGNC